MIATDPPSLADHELHLLLAEDVPFGDLTTESLGIAAESGTIRFFARDPMRVCGVEEAVRMFQLCGAAAEPHIASGRDAAPETLLLEARGSAGALHRGWKTAQTLMEWSGGIASSAAAIVAAARRGHADAMVAGTRKNVPGNRSDVDPAGDDRRPLNLNRHRPLHRLRSGQLLFLGSRPAVPSCIASACPRRC